MAEGGLPPASDKLRTVLDYVPCEACLTQKVADQELLCSVCHRLDRSIGVRVAVTTTVLLDRPAAAPPTAPVVIPPPGAPELPTIVVRYLPPGAKVKKHKPDPANPHAVEVFVTPYEEPAVAAPAPSPAPAEADVEWEDVASYEAPSDAFEYTRPAPPPPAPSPAPSAAAERAPEDDFVFRPPAERDPPVETVQEEPRVASEVEEDWMPSEEVPVRREGDAEEDARRWAPPAEPEPMLEEAPPPQAEPIDEPILDATLVDEEETVLETSMVEETPNDARSDLWRLRGFDGGAERVLAAVSITELSHLSGHDANELAARVGLDAKRIAAWVDVADLKEEVGVPLDAALALVAAGVAGPKALRDTDAEDVVAKVEAFGGGASVQLKDVKRWKRRA